MEELGARIEEVSSQSEINGVVLMHMLKIKELEKEIGWLVLAQILNALALVVHIIWG